MPFDHELADRILRSDDRDTALFFAGREAEIESVENAIGNAAEKRQTIFRIFQGAPGAGKTSLLDRLMDIHGADPLRLVVHLDHSDLTGADNVLAQIKTAAIQHRKNNAEPWNIVMNSSLSALRHGAELFKMPSLSKTIADKQTDAAPLGLTAILIIDEAQNLRSEHAETLQSMHTNGLGIDSVMLIGGLGHTRRRLKSMGLSRGAYNAATDLGALAREATIRSTTDMLDRLGPLGTEERRAHLAEAVAAMSHDWPQHLNCAQRALCMNLRQNGLHAGNVGLDSVREQTRVERFRYYEGRIDDDLLSRSPAIALRVIAAVATEKPQNMNDLQWLCEETIENEPRTRLTADDADAFADALVAKGVVCEQTDHAIVIPIPSMVDWAKSKLLEIDRHRHR